MQVELFVPTGPSLMFHIIDGYAFWSLFFGFLPMVWFYPLNELDFTGYELFAIALLSPCITLSKWVLQSIHSSKYVFVGIKILMLIGIASFQAPSTLSRLILLSVGTAAALVAFVANFTKDCALARSLHLWGIIVSFFLILVGRIWFVSILPTWSDKYSNGIVIAITSISATKCIFSEFTPGCSTKAAVTCEGNIRDAVISGIGFGSLLFITHWIFGEVSVPLRWIVTGYPHPGPNPNPFGICILASLIIGVLISDCYKQVSCSFKLLWWCIGNFGAFALFTQNGYLGFIGAMILGVYIMSIWPATLENLFSQLKYGPIGCSVSMFIYVVEILFLIWTVAYNFVPLGTYFRERSDLLLILVMGTIGLSVHFGIKGEKIVSSYFTIPKLVVIYLLLAGCCGSYLYAQRYLQHPLNSRINAQAYSEEFTCAIWTYHFAYDNEGWPSLERSAQLLNDSGADVITLLESDASKPFLNNNDLSSWLSERLGLYSDFGPSTRDHTWGTMLLSKHPIIESKHHLLPSPEGELAPAISATVNISGRMIDFVVTHMGNDRDRLDRMLQAKYLADLLRKSVNPVVFMGYITSAPYSENYKTLIEHGRMRDIDQLDYHRWCQYIMYRDLIRRSYGRISHGGLSDTELQIAQFKIPSSSNFQDSNHRVTDEDMIPENQRFTQKFGKFKKGHNRDESSHRFHMSTPKYFVSY